MRASTIVGILALSFTQATEAAEFMMFFMGGQSNMDGYGVVSELPEDLRHQQDVMIFHGNGAFDNQPNGGHGLWTNLKPGHGTGFKSDGKRNFYSDRFGAELTFASTVKKSFPRKKLAIIKYAVGGTGLALNTGYGNWSPDFKEGEGNNQYDFSLNTIRNAFSVPDIDGDGEHDTLVPYGIIWMQGEADAHASEASARAYYDNLTRLMALLRAALRKDDIPVVIGRVTDSELGEEDIMPFIQIVHQAQQKFVSEDICAGYMTQTEDYPYDEKDAWHYTSEGYIRMGADFANAMLTLHTQCK